MRSDGEVRGGRRAKLCRKITSGGEREGKPDVGGRVANIAKQATEF